MKEHTIPFNRAHIAGRELYFIAQAVANGELKGDGQFTRRCNEWFQSQFGINRCLLTHSCTAALEMSAILIGIQQGDEVIMPSFTFTSTANAFALAGAYPRFVDIRPDTLNIDENKIEAAINSKTKAICVMHYAGVACNMDSITDIAKRHGLYVIEDAAHAVMSKYKGKFLGSLSDLGTYSFHETKNYSCGEGGALLINTPHFSQRAEIIREKGTNRSQFFRGEVDKYSWVDLGSSYLPSELIAAFLYGQLERADHINRERLAIWQRYFTAFEPFAADGFFRLPIIPNDCEHNAHMFYMLLPSAQERSEFLDYMKQRKVGAVFHYLPLHTAVYGKKLGYKDGELPITEELSARLVRLPLFAGLSEDEQSQVIDAVSAYCNQLSLSRPIAANLQ